MPGVRPGTDDVAHWEVCRIANSFGGEKEMPGGEQVEVKLIIAVLEEGSLATVAALGDVVRDAGKDEAGKASHAARLTAADHK